MLGWIGVAGRQVIGRDVDRALVVHPEGARIAQLFRGAGDFRGVDDRFAGIFHQGLEIVAGGGGPGGSFLGGPLGCFGLGGQAGRFIGSPLTFGGGSGFSCFGRFAFGPLTGLFLAGLRPGLGATAGGFTLGSDGPRGTGFRLAGQFLPIGGVDSVEPRVQPGLGVLVG